MSGKKGGGGGGGGGGGKSKKPAIFDAIETEDLEGVVKELTPDNLELRNRDGFTPLICASYVGNVDILNFILSFGGCPTSFCKDGDTPLHYACAQGHLECIAILGQIKKVNLEATDNDGETPMDVCANGKAKKVLEKLLEKRAEGSDDEDGEEEGEEGEGEGDEEEAASGGGGGGGGCGGGASKK